MGRQKFGSTGKALAILCLVLFTVSLAAAPVNAASSTKQGDEIYDSYTQGYRDGYYKGYSDGFKEGLAGKDPRAFIMIYYGPDSGYEGGYFNGYKAGYGEGYAAGKRIYTSFPK